MGMIEGYWVRLSLRGDDTSHYLGSDEVWQTAEKALTDVCVAQHLPYKPEKRRGSILWAKAGLHVQRCHRPRMATRYYSV